MERTLVIYYSKSGNNKFLATKIATDLNCDSEELKPRINNMLSIIFATLTKISCGNVLIKSDIKSFDRVILSGPIWMGTAVSPIVDFIKKYGKDIKSLSFVTCCGGGDEEKDGKFGYATPFKRIKEYFKNRCQVCEAFPIVDIAPLELKDDQDAMMKFKINSENFPGPLFKRYQDFISKTVK